MASIGIDTARLRWLSVPHINGSEIAAALGSSAETLNGVPVGNPEQSNKTS